MFISRFRCRTEDTARSLVNALSVAGLYPELHEPRLPDLPWEVSAPAELAPADDSLSDLRSYMQAVADRAGASFDGCEAER